MDKPQPKREIVIDSIMKSLNWIVVYASDDALRDICEFGTVEPHYCRSYRLTVDARYDLDEVVKYIQEYDNE